MKKFLTIMAMFFAGATAPAAADAQSPGATHPERDRSEAAYPSDVIETADGGNLRIVFFGHGSIAFERGGEWIYIDPVSEYADYSKLPEAAVILVTHEHGDHLDAKAIDALSTDGTRVIGSPAAIEALSSGMVLAQGKKMKIGGGEVAAVPAYNTSPGQLQFHPKERLHNGYVLDFGGTRVYVAGDSEDTPEMLALNDIDIAFLPVNQPYTMKEEQAARAVKAIGPKIFYPYHYGGTDQTTDLGKLRKLIEDSGTDMRTRPLE